MTIPEILKATRNHSSTPAITITMPAHRHRPENLQDRIRLKNLVKTALDRLSSRPDGNYSLKKKLSAYVEVIDHEHNLEGLVLYCSEAFAEVVTVPISLPERVIVDDHFDLRPLFLADQQMEHYYIVTVSHKISRLIEVSHDTVIAEFNTDGFPFVNDIEFKMDELKNSFSAHQDNMVKEFLNRVDKALHPVFARNPLPYIVAGDQRTIGHFREVADHPERIVGNFVGSFDNTKTHELVSHALPVVHDVVKANSTRLINEVYEAQNNQLLALDINDINRLACEGRGANLYLSAGLAIPARFNNGTIQPTMEGESDVDDVVLRIVNAVDSNGGGIRFVELPDELGKLALTLRY